MHREIAFTITIIAMFLWELKVSKKGGLRCKCNPLLDYHRKLAMD